MPNRLIYVAMRGKRFVILHAFTKKSQKTPPKEIKIAERRYQQLQDREK
jgi:phage-related protein